MLLQWFFKQNIRSGRRRLQFHDSPAVQARASAPFPGAAGGRRASWTY